jgi:anti-anti-sigma regulatory factor
MITDARQVGHHESESGGTWVIEALAVIFGAHKRLRGAGGKGAAVAAAGERVARCFAVTGLNGHLPMYATAAEAPAAQE